MSFAEESELKDASPSWLRRLWFLSFSLLGCVLLYQASPWSQPERTEAKRAVTNPVNTQVETRPLTGKIEDIRVGQRLWSDNPEVDTVNETAVDPATWMLLRLRAEEVWDDGTLDDINVVTLQPPAWLVAHEAEVGAMVPLPLDLLEMGLPENLLAKVLAIERCPPLEDGPGRVVLTTVNHLNRDAYELTVADNSGRRETVYPTGLHKLYRDGEWTSVKDLDPADEVEAFGKPVTVLALTPKPGTHRVYNLTVESEHVYHVSGLGLLAHNNWCHFVPVEDLVNSGRRLASDETGTDLARRLGREGEKAAGVGRIPKERIPSVTRPGRYRIPDEMTDVSLREIKNVAKQSNTSQLRDFLSHAQETGRTFILETRPNTKLSGPLQRLIDDGLIIHRVIGQH